MGFKLRPGTSVFGNVTFTPGTNEDYVAPPIHQGPPPMTVGWSYAGLSESERVAPASNGMQLYRHDQPYTNAHSNRTLHNLPEYLEGLPFAVESASSFAENGIQGTTNAFEEYTFNTSGTLYLILRADWGGYNPSTLELQLSDIDSRGVLDPSTWTCVEDSVGYMGGAGDYGTYVFSKSVESGTHSLNNLYYYAFKADPAPESDPESAPEPAPAPSASNLVVSVNDGSDVYFYDIDNLSGSPTYIDPPQSTSNDQWVHAGTSDYNGTMVLGDIHIYTAGEIFIYDVSGSTPVLQHQLTPFDGSSGDYYSIDIAINDRFIAVGSPRDDDDGSFSGSVYIYDRSDLTAQPIKLTAENAQSGDRFGRSVTFTTDKLFVGAYITDEGATDTGSIYVYDINDFSAQAIEIVPPNPSYRKFTGYSIDSFGDTVVVGSYGIQDGSLYVYDATDLSSDPVHLTENLSGVRYGEYVSISQTHIATTAYKHNNQDGAVFVYDRSDLSAPPIEVTAPYADINALESYETMEFGIGGVDLSENKLAVGSARSGVYVYDIDNLSLPSITLLNNTQSTRLVKFV